MRLYVKGKVLEVEFPDPYVNPTTRQASAPTFRAYMEGDRRYAADYYDGPIALAPKPGDVVEQLCSVQARLSKAGNAWLSVWAVEDQAAGS